MVVDVSRIVVNIRLYEYEGKTKEERGKGLGFPPVWVFFLLQPPPLSLNLEKGSGLG